MKGVPDSEEKRLDILLENLNAVLWTVDRRLRFTSSQGAGLRELGLEEGQVAGMSLEEYLGTNDPDFPLLAMHHEALEGGRVPFESEWNGRHYRGVVEPILADTDEVVGAMGVALDVTEQHRAEEERKALLEREREARKEAEASHRRFEDFVHTLDAIVWEADAAESLEELRFNFVSRKAEEMLGYPIEDWYQPGFWTRILHPDDRDEAIAVCERATAQRRDHEFEYRVEARDGRVVWLRDLVRVRRDEEAGIDRMRGVMIDVTASKEAHREIQALNATLEARQQELTTYHDILTHDLSNLSMTLLGLLDHHVKGQDQPAPILRRARRQAFELTRMAENAKILIRLRDQGLPETLEAVPLAEVAERAVELVETMHFDRSLDMEVSCEKGATLPWGPFADNVMVNLIDNAIRHSSRDGPTRIRVEAAERAGTLELRVVGGRPNGEEVSPDVLLRHVHGEGSRGTGLGLALVRELVERSGGRIRVGTTEMGAERTFDVHIELPGS